jgi:hypothetical protein
MKRGNAKRGAPLEKQRCQELIDISGEVRAADLDGNKFTIKISPESRISGRFNSDQEKKVTLALREHDRRRLRVKGKGKFSPEGKLIQISEIQELILETEGQDDYDPNAKPIWQIASEIGASIPKEEWAKVPADLSKNLDHYLYGAPKIEK